LNDAVFEQYRRFGSETRILAGNSVEPAGNPPAPVAGDAVSTSPQPAPAATTDSPRTAEIGAAPATADEKASTPAPATVLAPAVPATAVAPAEPAEPEISIGTVSDQPASDQPYQPATAALDQPSGYTLKVTTRLVEDIEVLDNGRKQEIKFFSSVDAVSPAPGNTPVASPEPTFSNHTVNAAEGSPATPQTIPHTGAGATILLIDESHIAWNDMNNARSQMLQFLAAARPDERIGLYTMNSLGFRVLTEVTTDHTAVSARLRKWMPTAQSVAQAKNEETRNRQQIEETRNVSDLSSVNGNQADMPDSLSTVDPQLRTMGSNPARASLIIMVGVARRLGAVAGHKNLVWVSSDNVFADWSNQEVGTDRKTGFLDSFALRAGGHERRARGRLSLRCFATGDIGDHR
jgi:VWFA-related protein